MNPTVLSILAVQAPALQQSEQNSITRRVTLQRFSTLHERIDTHRQFACVVLGRGVPAIPACPRKPLLQLDVLKSDHSVLSEFNASLTKIVTAMPDTLCLCTAERSTQRHVSGNEATPLTTL